MTLDQIYATQYTPEYNAQRAGYSYVDNGNGTGYWISPEGDRVQVSDGAGPGGTAQVPNYLLQDLASAGYFPLGGDLNYIAQNAQYGAGQGFGGDTQALLDYLGGTGSSVVNDPRLAELLNGQNLIQAGDPTKASSPSPIALPNTSNGWFKDFAIPSALMAAKVYGAGTGLSSLTGLNAAPAAWTSGYDLPGGGALDGMNPYTYTMDATGLPDASPSWNSGYDLPSQESLVPGSPTTLPVGPGQIPSNLYQAALNSGLLAPGATGLKSIIDGVGPLSRIINGNGTADDWFKVGTPIVGGLLGAKGASDQASAYGGIADKFMALGAPSRARLEASYQPGFDISKEPGFQSALDTSAQTAARAYSAKVGNPADNPGAQAEILKYVLGSTALPQLNTYRSQNINAGGLGLDTSGAAMGNQAQAQGGVYNAVGYGLGQAANPQTSIDDLMKRLSGTGPNFNGFTLNNSGSLFK